MGNINLLTILTFFLVTISHVWSENSCTPHGTCADCLVKGGADCFFCQDENFHKDNSRAPRCNLKSELLRAGCNDSFITKEATTQTTVKDDPLTDTVQVKPQAMNVKLRIGEPATFKVKVKSALNFPVDLYYLMDMSNSMKDDLEKLNKLAVNLAEAIGKITTNYRLGFGTFVDKPVAPFIPIERKNKKTCSDDSCDPTFGYRHVMSFEKNPAKFKRAISETKISTNTDRPEGSMDALMQAAVCEQKIGWQAADKARRIIILVTDAYPKIAGDGKIGGIVTPNDGLCHLEGDIYSKSETMDYPSIGFLRKKMKEHKILPIIASTPAKRDSKEDPLGVYQDIADAWSNIGAVAAKLEGDSSNIVQLVADAYTKISQTVRLQNDAPRGIKVEVQAESRCNGAATDTCNNVKPGETVEFEVSVTAQNCDEEVKNGKSFTINIVGFGDVIVNYNTICECDCRSTGVNKSPKCSLAGTHACGICYCEEGRFGPKCNCTDASTVDDTLCMRNETDPNEKVCSGFGRCICGNCQCIQNENNPEEVISGTYCQCTNFGCERHLGKLCGGADRGVCECGKCKCIGDYIGSNCGKINCSIADKYCTRNGKICSGNGQCECDASANEPIRCVCDEGFKGKHCEREVSCSSKEKTIRDCVLCQAFERVGVSDTSVCDTCNIDIRLVDDIPSNEKRCSLRVNDTCHVIFSFDEDVTNKINDTITVQRQLRCVEIVRKKVNVLPIILGTIGGTVVLGLLFLLIWKLLVTTYDNHEYSKFERERMKSKWKKEPNPLYKNAKQQFVNPAYAGDR